MERHIDQDYFSKPVTEDQFEDDIKEDLKSIGVIPIKMPCSMEKGLVLPDLLCILPKNDKNLRARVFFIEVKTPTGRLQKIQEVTFKHFQKYVDIYTIRNWEEYYSLVNTVKQEV